MVRTPTPAPTDKKMWRRLLRVVHPDTYGDHDLFIWAGALFEHVAGDAIEEAPRHVRREPPKHHPRTTSGDRIPFEEAFDRAPSFTHLTEQALGLAENGALDPAHAALLRLLADCREMGTADRILYRQQHEGATYRTLAAIAYKAGLSTSQRIQWYRVCESIPLSQRHDGHIISRMANSEASSACA
jgi:hypothetical protein